MAKPNIKSQLPAVKEAVKYINKKTKNFKPDILFITGSGMAGSIPDLENKVVIPTTSIPNFLECTVVGHPSNLIFGTYKGKKLMIMQGRYHYYEGYQIRDLAFSLRTASFLGVKTVLVSAAVGSLNTKLDVGTLCVLNDHINLMMINPLIGNHDDAFGPRFVVMSNTYEESLRKTALKIAKKIKIKVGQGVYAALTGPNFETPAEVRALRILKADVVGMSVVPEVISAKQLGLKVCGLTWVVNMAEGLSKVKLSHDLTIQETKKIEGRFKKFLENFIPEIDV